MYIYICTHMLRIENILSFQVHQENEKKKNKIRPSLDLCFYLLCVLT